MIKYGFLSKKLPQKKQKCQAQYFTLPCEAFHIIFKRILKIYSFGTICVFLKVKHID